MAGVQAIGANLMPLDRQALWGIAYVVFATASFATLDTATKFVSGAVSFALVMWFRFGFQILTTGIWLQRQRGSIFLKSQAVPLQIYRGILLTLSSVMAFFSLKLIPVADFTAIMMLTPLLMTVIAAFGMKEKVSPLRWLFVLTGFVGALVVIRPGNAAFTWGSLLPFLLVFMSAGYQLLTYQLAKIDDAATTHWYTGLIGFVFATLALPFVIQSGTQAWLNAMLGAWDKVGWLILIGVFATLGHGLLILGYARAPVATLTPYLYVQIPFAVLGGWLVFAHQLDVWAIIGMVIIATSGVLGTWVAARQRQMDVRVILDN
ncbi:MAG: DMT family transporter [Cytophagales bacterium]|nr:DMT family transporter [Cytophagales bacterium]